MLVALEFFNIVIAQEKSDVVNGNMIQFNDNGFWCWYQDERALIDTDMGKLIVGSDASGLGTGGSDRNGHIDAVIYDFNSGISNRYELAQMGCDDHNAPGFVIRPDGKYLAMYSAHYDYYKNRYRIFDGENWSSEDSYDWTLREGGTNYTIAYNNVYYLSAEDRMYDFSRANNRSPNFIISDDWGDSWIFGGQLTTNSSDSYNKGYYKYWSNGIDRIDFLFTEQHPRDTLTSIYHGYMEDGKLYDSFDNIVDEDIYDDSFIPGFWNFTLVFANGTVIGQDTLKRCWQSDLMRYDDGTVAAIISARTNQFFSNGYNTQPIADADHAFVYCRFDGDEWNYTYLCKAGKKFYESEEDYVGLGALCPNDPNKIYVSTPFSPIDTSLSLGTREIWMGVTSDDGASWNWSPITEKSTKDNIRPIVPEWDENNTALLWCRGSYTTAQGFDAAIVGIFVSDSTYLNKNYVDADTTNTFLATGDKLEYTGPSDSKGVNDDKWHLRNGYGNGEYVFTTSESRGEDAPELYTEFSLPDSGEYHLWVNFWASPDEDWRIKAGLTEDNMQIFRHMACQQVQDEEYSVEIVSAGENNTYLYQAYLGKVKACDNFDQKIYIDDYNIKTGSNSTKIGATGRTWYDGITYAPLKTNPTAISSDQLIADEFYLGDNYPNPFNPSTTIEFSVPKMSTVSLKIFDITGRQIATLIDKKKHNQGNYQAIWTGKDRNGMQMASGVYFYKLQSGNHEITKKMILMK